MVNRYSIQVRGVVQGVGFRPFVHGLASGLGLGGSVRNVADHVLIEVEGETRSLGRFLRGLSAGAPPLARIEEVWCEARPTSPVEVRGFAIGASASGARDAVAFPCDVATCSACLAEMFEPADRRHRHPFISCTNCGPRWTIIGAAPYDRASTTMACFPMCPPCRAEYEDPVDRRFHAQPICCPDCGPRLRFEGTLVGSGDPLEDAITALRGGRIGAVKGIGGYHLACDARSRAAVAGLLSRKGRDEKPLAILVADLAATEEWCEVSLEEAALLASPRRPIVLLRKRHGADLPDGIAAGGPFIGVMLAYSPLHHLLVRGVGGPLVMTSGNAADEPIAFEDDDARARLAGIADFLLTHDRPIQVRCDDSVTRVAAGGELLLRRSRGYVPEVLLLPRACPVPTLALGAQQKSAFGIAKGRRAVLSHHLGDLDDLASYGSFEDAVGHFEALFGTTPELMVRDLHPDYATARYTALRGGPTLRVQHHHAHVASCMADNRLDGPVLGVALDGTGLGTDGAIWGGEFLAATYEGFRRVAHLRYVRMPGGSRAIREPWRMALAYLDDAGEGPDLIGDRVAPAEREVIGAMLARGVNSPLTSSAGRLFDGVAALAGLRHRVRHEGQAAIELEWRSAEVPPDYAYPFEVAGSSAGAPLAIDTRPLISAVAADARRGVAPGRIGRRFHSAMVAIIAEVCGRIRASDGLDAVALSGGVFMNVLLLEETIERLERDGFAVYRHRHVPPNDGGLCLGQLAIAAANPWPSRTAIDEGGADVPGDTR